MDKWEINWSESIAECNIKINGEMLRGVQALEFKPKSTYSYDPKTEDRTETDHVPEGWNKLNLSLLVKDENLDVLVKGNKIDHNSVEISLDVNKERK